MVERLRRDARLLAAYFRLELCSIEPERAQVKARYGVCYSDGSIRIRLHHATTGRLLKYSGMVDTLCHELAHLRYFDHGMRFRLFYHRIREHARHIRVYRPEPRRRAGPPRHTRLAPRPPPAPGPVQLDLFSGGT